MSALRIAFFGIEPYGLPILAGLLRSDAQVVAVVSRDGPRDRGLGRRLKSAVKRWIRPPSFETLAAGAGVPLLVEGDVNAPEFVARLVTLAPDLVCVGGFAQIFRPALLGVPRLGVVNFHPSLLPAYRGPVPTFWAIRDGASRAGVTATVMTAGVDAGPILGQASLDIDPGDTGSSLLARIGALGGELAPAVVADIVRHGRLLGVPQDETVASHQSRFTPADCQLHWLRPAAELERLSRACRDWRCAWFALDAGGVVGGAADQPSTTAARIEVESCRLRDTTDAAPGTIVAAAGPLVQVMTMDRVVELSCRELSRRRADGEPLSWPAVGTRLPVA